MHRHTWVQKPYDGAENKSQFVEVCYSCGRRRLTDLMSGVTRYLDILGRVTATRRLQRVDRAPK